MPLSRVMVVGSCLVEGYPAELTKYWNCPCDYFLINNEPRLPALPHRPEEYDFQVVQIPLSSILPSAAYFRLEYADIAAYQRLLRDTEERLTRYLAAAMRWNTEHGLLTFVFNFLLPQQNAMGRLLPRYDLRNPLHFVEKLNEHLSGEIAGYRNAYLFDQDQVKATFGRRYFQDDAVCRTNHNAALWSTDYDYDRSRLEPPLWIFDVYQLRTIDFIRFDLIEILSMYRTIRQIDQVKLVVVDIDDTLWRGVMAEGGDVSAMPVEGWPIGVVEALGYLKRRGILLAIVSKNDEAQVKAIWKDYFGGLIDLDDFAVRKINWRPKADNLEEILGQVKLLPGSVVFIDDNPAERAAIVAAFPGVRAFGSNPLVWRRILLWAAETQVAAVTEESARRTEMVQAQVAREQQRQQVSRADFLSSLEIAMTLNEITRDDHPWFPRVLELINKTNQFNTTGRRWTRQEFGAAFARGLRVLAFEVTDRYTPYGIVGVILVDGTRISQFVMSCRVVGLDVELAAIAEVMRVLGGDGLDAVSADLIETDKNLLCRDLYERCGFAQEGDVWRRCTLPVPERPGHIRISWLTDRI
jgi:FkbH-like protein